MEPPKVTVEISTKNRYDILSNCLQSVISQTYKPFKIILFDDSDNPIDLRNDSKFFNLFRIMDIKGIQWEVVFGEKVGQVANHQKALERCETEWLYRCDDDNILECNTLEKLIRHTFNDKVGAVASCVLHPGAFFHPNSTSGKIEDCNFKYAVQFAKFDGVQSVDHLYSTFLYRKSAAIKHGYEKGLSRVGHREETLFSYQMKRAGWDLLVDGSAITWHFQFPTGGIRDFSDGSLWWKDQQLFEKRMSEWGVNFTKYKFVYLDNGIGDHFAFKHILKEVKAKFSDHKIIIAPCYPEVFADEEGIELIDLNSGKILGRDWVEKLNIYRFCFENKWSDKDGNLVEAFRKMYLL